jgi:hypothetical protein
MQDIGAMGDDPARQLEVTSSPSLVCFARTLGPKVLLTKQALIRVMSTNTQVMQSVRAETDTLFAQFLRDRETLSHQPPADAPRGKERADELRKMQNAIKRFK